MAGDNSYRIEPRLNQGQTRLAPSPEDISKHETMAAAHAALHRAEPKRSFQSVLSAQQKRAKRLADGETAEADDDDNGTESTRSRGFGKHGRRLTIIRP